MTKSSNDNDLKCASMGNADAYGRAALLLIESLILSLIDRSTIGAAEAQDIVSIALDAADELARDGALPEDSIQKSISLLTEIKHSLPLAP